MIAWFISTNAGQKVLAFAFSTIALLSLLAAAFGKGKKQAILEQEHEALKQAREAKEIENEVEAMPDRSVRERLNQWVRD